MLLREALTTVPDRIAARRVAIAIIFVTAGVFGGTVVVLRRHPTPAAQIPTIMIPPPRIAVASMLELPVNAAPEVLAKSELQSYAFDLFPRWVVTHPNERCPDRLLELNRFDPRVHAIDPWGTPYQFLCGHGVGFTTRSAGPDGSFDTEDDLAP